jgi:hypothetical protein
MSGGERIPIIIPRLDDPSSVTADERDEHLMLLETARHQLEVEFTETLGVADGEGDYHLFGYPSTVAYLKDRLGVAGGRAHRYVKRARAALQHTSTMSAWKHRQITSDQAELLFAASQRLPDRYPNAEETLLEICGDTAAETRQILDYWFHRADEPGVTLELETQLARRRFEVTRRDNGMVEGDFALPTMAGDTLLTAIDALMPPPAPDDGRTTAQRRADALEDLARSFLDGSETPIVGGERPHILVHVDLDTLHDRAGGLHETLHGQVVDLDSVRRLACEASITRVVFGPGSEVLDVGRKTRVIPTALRRAVIARDRHCTRPGCSRSARWCDVHHIVSWAEGGETVITNLCLLCRYHHTLTHLQEGEEIESPYGDFVGGGRRRSI